MTYELYAIAYAESGPNRRRSENLMGVRDDPDAAPMPLRFYVWVALGHGRVVLVDAGATRESCEARGMRYLRSPLDGLRKLGIEPEQVDTVVSTHLHWDHAGHLDAFPEARIHAHEDEVRFATGPAMIHPALRRTYNAPDVATFVRLVHEGRVEFHDGDAELAPGIRLRPGPGHTPGQCFVEVDTARGTVVLASDALHFFENAALGVPFPIVSDVPAYLDTLAALDGAAASPELIVPGHDPSVALIYPAPSTGPAADDELIVRLDVSPRNPPV